MRVFRFIKGRMRRLIRWVKSVHLTGLVRPQLRNDGDWSLLRYWAVPECSALALSLFDGNRPDIGPGMGP